MAESMLSKVAVRALVLKGKSDVKHMLNCAKNAKAVNEKLLFKILQDNKNSEYGKRYDFENIHSIEDFRKKVPITEYADYQDEITEFYQTNENFKFSSNKVIGYAKSSGSIGVPKLIPKTDKDIAVYTRYTATRFVALADDYLRKHGQGGLKPARGICLLAKDDSISPCGLPSSNVADVAERKFEKLEPIIMSLPMGRQFIRGEIDRNYAYARFGLENEDCSYMFYVFAKGVAEFIEYIQTNWKSLVDEIEKGTLSQEVFMKDETRAVLNTKVKPNPKRAAALRKEFEKGFDETILKRIWPNLSVISAIGTSALFDGFTQEIKRYSKGILMDYSIYGASEGLVAAAYESDNPGQVLLTDSCYMEFFKEDDENAETIYGVDELEKGQKYEILITNQSGFYRYRLKDVIEVLDFYEGCPVINFVYRKGQLLNATGEKTNIEQMTEAVKRLGKVAGTKINEWAVMVEKGTNRYHYVLVAENDSGKNLSIYAEDFDKILCDVNPSYKTDKDLLGTPIISNQKRGTHKEWEKYKASKGAAESQIKPVRHLDTDEKKEFFLSRLEEN